jgi:phosphoribosylaminoimidazole (AIR) synthetase
MLNTFNCGVGFVLVVDPAQAETVQQWLKTHYSQAFDVAEIGVLAEKPADDSSESVVFETL